MPSSVNLKGQGWVVGAGVGVTDGIGVKKRVGRGVRVGLAGRGVGEGIRNLKQSLRDEPVEKEERKA